MKYKISVDIKYDDRTETQVVEGEDINYVLNRVVDIQFENIRYKIGDLVFNESDPKKKKELKRQAAKTATENLKKRKEYETNLLKKALSKSVNFSWNKLLTDFYVNNPQPIRSNLPNEPQLFKIPEKPQKDSKKYQPEIGIFDRIIVSRKKALIKQCEELYKDDYKKWEQEKLRIENINKKRKLDYDLEVNKIERKYEQDYKIWSEKKNNILNEQQKQKKDYETGEKDGIEKYFELVLISSNYEKEFFTKQIYIKYFTDTRILFVEYYLPDKKDLISVKEIKYVITKDEFQEVHFSDNELNKMYDTILYEITLRTLNEIFKADYSNSVDQIVFNGFVDSIDKSTGQHINPCIISIAVTKEQFLDLNLMEIEPKKCFQGLKGISASKLYTLTPVAPIMQIDKDDRRIVEGYSVAGEIDDSTNVAAMDWQDFENLVREIFEKEFAQGGGEVKVTQASRDGGVDAIAFDPDPIRGGKIVIQAKRYTNVVGVAAVRDLYGTVVNEGATKGILVTTSNYGPDAYDFAKDKPITLLNGANLLHLLEKHGHKAKIDLKEAKRILGERE